MMLRHAEALNELASFWMHSDLAAAVAAYKFVRAQNSVRKACFKPSGMHECFVFFLPMQLMATRAVVTT